MTEDHWTGGSPPPGPPLTQPEPVSAVRPGQVAAAAGAFPAPVSGAGGHDTPASGGSAAGPANPGESGRPAARTLRRPGSLGTLSIGQVLVAEVAVLISISVATRGSVPGLIAGGAAVLVLVVTFARRHGRWWLEDRLIGWQYRRRRAAAVDPAAGPVLAALRTIAPGLAVRDVSAPDGARAGVGRDEAGWFVAVALTPAAPVHQEAAPIPIDALIGVLADAQQPGVVLQLVTHTVPAPSLGLHPASLAGSSYRQLTGMFGSVPLPAHRESTVAVRLDARALAEALLDHTADLDAAAALVASLGRRVATSLRRLGIGCRVLDADELIRTLARSCDLETITAGTADRVREEWTRWHSAGLAHRTFWLSTWPADGEQVGALFEWVAATPAAQSTVALILEPAPGDEVAGRALIRVAAPAEHLPELSRRLTEGVTRIGGELFPLDGEQGPGVYATAPTGGGPG